jgi:5-methylcytosine-specific restriction endonuclease McrA
VPYKDPEKNREAKRKWKRNHPQQVLEIQRNWRKNNPEKQTEYGKKDWQRIKSNPFLLKKQYTSDKKRREKNIEKSRERERIASTKYRLAHPERRKLSQRKWEKKNPKKVLAKFQRHISKIGKELDLSFDAYQFALRKWSGFIRAEQNNKCQICFKEATAVHHIFHKVLYPKLSLNFNNGICLCNDCHNESHGKCL